MTATEFLDLLRVELSGHSRYTVNDYFVVARRFLGEHPNPEAWSVRDAAQFLQNLRNERKVPGTIRTYLQRLRKLYEIAGKEKPKLRAPYTAADILNEHAPPLSRKETELLISASLGSPFPAHAGRVALATVYGLRPGEIGAITGKAFDQEKGLILVPTLKGNPPRIHQIPEVLRGVLRPESFPRTCSDTDMWACWNYLERRAGIPDRERQCWGSVRRTLFRLLREAGMMIEDVDAWMGHAPRIIGYRYSMRRQSELDAVIFPRHPLLSVWARSLSQGGG